MTNLNIAKLYLANNPTATAEAITTAMGNGTAAAVEALSGTALLNAIYKALFGRNADAEGLAYWGASTLTGDALIDAISGGAATYPADGAFAALNAADKATLANKALVVTTGVSEAEAVFILDTVTDSAATVTLSGGVDTIEWAAKLTTADTIKSFTTGASGDNLDIAAAGTIVGTAALVEVSSASKGTIAGEKVAVVLDNAAADWSNVLTILNAAFDTTGVVTSDTIILIDNGTDTRVYLYEDDTHAAAIETAELSLQATLSGVKADAGVFHTANFTLA